MLPEFCMIGYPRDEPLEDCDFFDGEKCKPFEEAWAECEFKKLPDKFQKKLTESPDKVKGVD